MREIAIALWSIHIPLDFGLKNNTPLLFCIESVVNCYILISTVNQSIFFGQFKPNHCLFKIIVRDKS